MPRGTFNYTVSYRKKDGSFLKEVIRGHYKALRRGQQLLQIAPKVWVSRQKDDSDCRILLRH